MQVFIMYIMPYMYAIKMWLCVSSLSYVHKIVSVSYILTCENMHILKRIEIKLHHLNVLQYMGPEKPNLIYTQNLTCPLASASLFLKVSKRCS